MSRAIHKLSARRVEVETRVGKHGDGGGLALLIAKDGSKRWVFAWERHGRRREMGLGPTSEVGLAKARELAANARQVARNDADSFPGDGTTLERYSRVLNAVEVNSSFHRAHRPSTWASWAETVPEQFRFAVKIPSTITHQAKLVDIDTPVARVAEEVQQFGSKLAILLVQLPPKVAFDAEIASRHISSRAAIASPTAQHRQA